MGTVVEIFADDKGLVWPKELTPFPVHLVSITSGNEQVSKEADRLYEQLRENGIECLYDDRDVRAGEKFADSDLLGIPLRIVISEKTMSAGGAEVIERASDASKLVPESGIIEYLQKNI
jgi:prolyl-tRNA synthetase